MIVNQYFIENAGGRKSPKGLLTPETLSVPPFDVYIFHSIITLAGLSLPTEKIDKIF